MSKLKVAVLEDEPMKLKELVLQLRETGLVEVVATGRERSAFLEAVAAKPPEALILDIDLVGEPDGGIAVARELGLPVLFISGHVGSHMDAIEILDATLTRVPIAHLSKPWNADSLKSRLLKFSDQVNGMRKQCRVVLQPKGKGTMEVSLDSIVAIIVEKREAESNNKRVLFNDREPIVIADVSLTRLAEYGLPAEAFVFPACCSRRRAWAMPSATQLWALSYL